MKQKLTPFYKKGFFALVIAGCCLLCSCGTTGHITFYDYRVSKDTLQAAIKRFLVNNPAYNFPKNDSAWQPYTPQDSVMDNFLENDGHIHYRYRNLSDKEEYIYFKNKREEVYELHYSMNRAYWNKHPHFSRLALVGVVKKGGNWRYCDRIFGVFFWGRRRVEKRLETELLNKLPYKFEKTK